MKIFILPIIASAMTVFAQTSSPFSSLTTAVITYDNVLQAWTGSIFQLPGVLTGTITLQSTVVSLCNNTLSAQPPDVQEVWLDNGNDLLEALSTSMDITISKQTVVQNVLMLLGFPIFKAILQVYQSFIPICIDNLRPAFDDNHQGALDNIRDTANRTLERAVAAYSSASSDSSDFLYFTRGIVP